MTKFSINGGPEYGLGEAIPLPNPIINTTRGKHMTTTEISSERLDIYCDGEGSPLYNHHEFSLEEIGEITAMAQELRDRRAAGGEAVAWRGDGENEFGSIRKFTAMQRVSEIWADQGLTVTPLYLHPSSSGVAVKAMKWHDDTEGPGCPIRFAAWPLHGYRIHLYQWGEADSWAVRFGTSNGVFLSKKCDAEEAKAMVQEEWVAYLQRAALHSSPDTAKSKS